MQLSFLSGYRVLDTSKVQVWGMDIDLERMETLDPIFEGEEKYLKCVISYETDSRLRVKIFNPNKSRYEVLFSVTLIIVMFI